MKEENKKEKKNTILRNVSILFISISVILSMFLALYGHKHLEENTTNQIKAEMVDRYDITSNEINYIRKLDSKFYEIVLDDGEVYTFRREESGKPVIKHLKENIEKIEVSSDEGK